MSGQLGASLNTHLPPGSVPSGARIFSNGSGSVSEAGIGRDAEDPTSAFPTPSLPRKRKGQDPMITPSNYCKDVSKFVLGNFDDETGPRSISPMADDISVSAKPLESFTEGGQVKIMS